MTPTIPVKLINSQSIYSPRVEMPKAFPSLPQNAGRAYEAIRANAEGATNQVIDRHRERTTTTVSIAMEQRSLRIAGIAHPKIDHYRLARALLSLERHDLDGKLYAKAAKIRDRRSD